MLGLGECAKIAHVDTLALGRRIAQARSQAGMTQEGLGSAASLDRTAITRLEKGERKLSVPELVTIAAALHRPLSYFVTPPVPAVVSRRSDSAHAHATTEVLDTELEQFAADVKVLIEMSLLDSVKRPANSRIPKNHGAAERMAESSRKALGLGNDPILDLGEVCGRLGLHTFSAGLGRGGADGGCVEVSDAQETAGATVVNGDAPAGRRRMTLAHELGHWLSGDAYDSEASQDSERMLNSFAIHFLAPRAGVTRAWGSHAGWPIRDRVLAIGASFRLSWSAAVGQLVNLGLIEHTDRDLLIMNEPKAGDFARLGLSWVDELASPYLSPQFTAACLNGYVTGRLTADRVLELLRNTLVDADLPNPEPPSLSDLRKSFMGHDG